MKKVKRLSVRKGYLAALALAVVFGGAVQFGGSDVGPKNLQTAVVPTGYASSIWIKTIFPSSTYTSPVTTITHADSGDTLKIAYNVRDVNGGALEASDCGGLTLYYGTSVSADNTAKTATIAPVSSTGTGCVATANLVDSSGNPLKLALGSTSDMFTSYAGAASYTQLGTKASPTTQWTGSVTEGTAGTVEALISSTYGTCDYGKYWDTTTSTCIAQPSCGSGWWDTATNACKYSTCTTDTWSVGKPECGPTDTDYSKCRDPFYWYNKTTGGFEKCSRDTSVRADFCNNTVEHTPCDYAKTDRVTLLEKYFAIDAANKTTWLASSYPSFWVEPSYDSTAPYKKYDPATDTLVACSNTTTATTTWTSGTFYASCQTVPVKYEDWYKTKWRMDYADWKKWNPGTTTTCPSATPYRCTDNSCAVSATSCPSTVTTCDNDKVCEPNNGETSGTCPADCSSTTTCPAATPIRCSDNSCVVAAASCPSATTCSAGQTWNATKGFCVSSTWKEVAWNDLGLKSYVSNSLPADVEAAAKKACATVKPEYVYWPNPSDDTKPATFGVPDCSGTKANTCDYDALCESNETSATCSDCSAPVPVPVPGPVPLPWPTKCSATDTKCINSGETGSVDGWCYNGMSCYNKEGTKKYCQPYGNTTFGGMMPYTATPTACPETFPKQCNPTDTKCIESNAYGPEDGWCMSAMECFVDGKKFCQPWSNNMNSTTTCPAGSKQCSSTDKTCIEPGSKGPIGGWCKNGSECYNTSGTEKYCLPWDVNPNGYEACPATHPKSCRPDDKNCIEIGGMGSSTGWCASGGKQCYVDAGIKCVSWEESCPAGSKACRAGDVGCVEPGTKTPLDPNNQWGKWCAGSSVSCYSKTEMECIAVDSSRDPQAWEKVKCSAGFSRCREDDKYCLELGESGPSGSWCASGMMKWSDDPNSDGMVTCVPGDGVKEPLPIVDPLCIDIRTTAYDKTTNDCKLFTNTCDIPETWATVTDGTKVCGKDGKLINFDLVIGDDDASLKELIESARRRVKEYELQLRDFPPHMVSQTAAVEAAIEDAAKTLKELLQRLPTKSKAERTAISEVLSVFYKDTLTSIEAQMAKLTPNMEINRLKEEWSYDVRRYETLLGNIDPDSEDGQKLESMIEKISDLIASAQNQSGDALSQLLVVIKDARNQLENFVAELKDSDNLGFFEQSLRNLYVDHARFKDFIAEEAIDDEKIDHMMKRLIKTLNTIEDKNTGEVTSTLLDFLNQATMLRDRIESWLVVYGLEAGEKVSISDIIKNYVDDVVADKFEKLFGEVKLILDEKFQALAVKVAEVQDLTEKLTDQLAQSVNNLQYVIEKHRDAIIEAKTRIVDEVESLKQLIETSDFGSFTARKMADIMNRFASTTWCGDIAGDVQNRLNDIGLDFESGEYDTADVDALEAYYGELVAENSEACYTGGYTYFRDTPMDVWYFGPTQVNFEKGWISGYRDAEGNLLGQIGPGNATLRIEAIKMFMNLFGAERGGYEIPAAGSVTGVPNWPNTDGNNEANTFVNGALKAGVNLAKYGALDQPITRAETAALIYDIMVASGANFFKPADTFTHVEDYNDADRVLANKEYARIIEALTDLGIFKGSSETGNFDPANSLVRSEFATLNDRIWTILGLGEVK